LKNQVHYKANMAEDWPALPPSEGPNEDDEDEEGEECHEENEMEDITSASKLPCLVADSAAFIRNVDLDKLASKVFTIPDVLSEIRDPTTRQRLQVLPYDIHMREPSQDAIKFVTEFSKKTGDFKVLSAVDMRVLALTYQLTKEFGGGDNIRDEPQKKTEVVPKSKLVADNQMAGFYIVKSKRKNKKGADVPADERQAEEAMEEEASSDELSKTEDEQTDDSNVVDVNENQMNVESEGKEGMEGMDTKDSGIDEEVVEDEHNDEDDDDDDAGWITPSNIKAIKQQMGDDGSEQQLDVSVVKCGCLTTDFAMQNVLIQMGLSVISVDGRLIRQARNYILKCYGCNKETSNMAATFCPSCGNKTLMRVAVTIAADGTTQYHYPKRRRNFNIRGTKFSLPKPEGGRRGDDIILCEDQKMKYKNMPKQRDIVNALDPEYMARDSPFTKTDTTSKAFNLGNHLNRGRTKNPNASKKSGRKKK